jgi:hypothetical protein
MSLRGSGQANPISVIAGLDPAIHFRWPYTGCRVANYVAADAPTE